MFDVNFWQTGRSKFVQRTTQRLRIATAQGEVLDQSKTDDGSDNQRF